MEEEGKVKVGRREKREQKRKKRGEGEEMLGDERREKIVKEVRRGGK